MKTYKIKSIFYFSCFLLASIVYYGIEQKTEFDRQLQANQVVDLVEDELEEEKDESLEEQP